MSEREPTTGDQDDAQALAAHAHRDAGAALTLPETITGAAATTSPCTHCATKPCCWYVSLETIEVTHYVDLDRLIFASGFARLEIGAHDNGRFTIFYRAPCTYLQASGACGVWGKPEMPLVCRSVDAHDCWHKSHVPNATNRFIRLDEARMRHVAELYRFDTKRAVTERPSWDELRHEVRRYDRSAPPAVSDAPVAMEHTFPWQRPERALKTDLSWDQASANPCAGCAAYCCTRYVLKVKRPETITALDRLVYLSQFPGIEIGVRDDSEWIVAIRTRCSHLTATNDCGLFGSDERPRSCVDFNAYRCSYPARFGDQGLTDTLRIGHEDFRAVAARFTFDDDGAVVSAPTMHDAVALVGVTEVV